ncbi:hypothetical protein [Nocardioides sp.]|uniref:hypothetical protein n=1 Tax=Nocardioides sp. TaxID=35761 RepID=UPI002619F8D0|nr:hypothetical protein [Nocardioides sp.]MDI6911484.1 hypothetical protein [Nocardioides sp.]
MAAEEEVGLRLSLKNRHETVSGLDDVGDKLDRVGDEADRAGRKARYGAAGLLSFGRSGRIAGRAVVYGMGAAAAGVVGAGIALTKLSKDSIAEARESQKVGAVTRSEIKATGQVANVTAKQVGRLAGAISDKVGVDDEEIQAGANMVLTFKNVRNEIGKGSKIFSRATRDAVDLAKAGFGSITSQSKMLAKALNDPIKGLSAMSRSGVTFTQQQQDRIKGLVEEGDLLKSQKIILGEVESQVGGVAEAQATWGDKAAVSIGNIKERIGLVLLPALDGVEKWFVQKGAPVLDRWVGVFEDRGIPAIERFARKAVPAVGDFLEEARPLAESVIPAIGTGLETAADAFKVIAPKAKAVFEAFNNLPDWAKQGIAIAALGGLAAKRIGAFDRGSLLGSIATTAKPLPVWVVNGGGGLPTTGKPGGPTPFGGPGGGGPKWVPGMVGNTLGTALTALGFAMANSDPDNVHPGLPGLDVTKVMSQEELLAQERRRNVDDYKRRMRALDELLVGPLGKIKDVNTQFDFLGTKRPTPKVATPGMDEAVRSGDRLIGILGVLDRTESRPTVVLDGVGTAELRVQSLQSKLQQLSGQGVFLPGGSPTPGSSGNKWDGLRAPKHPRPVPSAGRVTVPQGPDLPDVAGWADEVAVPDTVVQLYLDGKVLMESTVRNLQTKAARA